MISYEMARQLQDAGWPDGGKGNWATPPEKIVLRSGDRAYVPTLSELTEACGGEFKCLRNFRHEMWAAHGKKEGERQYKETWPSGNDWVAEAVSTYTAGEGTTGAISAHGHSAEEAVARLWLALHANRGAAA
jgi:hypothetical protein